MRNPQTPPFARTATLVPTSSLAMDVGVVFAGAAVTAIGAQITIPTLPVPITLQTMGVMLCGLTLGARRGALSQLLYLAAGAAGAPVFAAWSGGPARLFGPTGGYLVSFVLIAGLLGWLAERGWDRRVSTCAAALAIAFPLQLFLGTAWLAVYLGWSKAWMAGFVPFIGWEASKGLVVLVLLPGVNSLLGRQPTPRL